MFELKDIIEHGKSVINQIVAEGNSYSSSIDSYMESVDLEYDLTDKEMEMIDDEIKESFQEELLEE